MPEFIKSLISRLIKTHFSVDGLDNAIAFEVPIDSGLANELRGLTSAMLMAQEKSRKFYINWGEMIDMPGIHRLSELFEYPKLDYTSANRSSLNRLQRFYCFFENRKLLAFTDWLRCELLQRHQFNNILCDMIANNVNFSFPTIIISTYYSFYSDHVSGIDFYDKRHRMYKTFVPVKGIQKRYKEFIRRYFGEYTVGVHIRTKKSQRRFGKVWDSPPDGPVGRINFDLFSSLVDCEIQKNPETRIFLATDNIAECRPFMERYKDRLIMYPKKNTNGMVDRFTAEDVKNALIDLYLLANTQKLFGTKQSTFSYEAAIIGNVPFIEISGLGLRQEYRLIYDKKVVIDLRDNGIGTFSKEMLYDKKKKESFKVFDAVGKNLIEFFYDELKKIDRPVVFDVGASTGCFSLVSKFLDRCKIYAFEPNKLLADVLRSNLMLNNVEGKVEIHNIGLMSGGGERVLTIPNCDQYALGHYGQLGKNDTSFRTIVTRTETLDEFVYRNRIEKLDFIKIHTEGDECELLKGGRKTIHNFRPKMLLEVNKEKLVQCGADRETLFHFIEDLGYRYHYVGLENIYCVPLD